MSSTDTPKKKAAAKSPRAPSSLIPDPKSNRLAVAGKVWFWCGALPSSPVSAIYLAGIDFNVMTEEVSDATMGQNSDRVPMIGACRAVTRDQLEKIGDALRQKMIRFEEPPGTMAVVTTGRKQDGSPGVEPTEAPIGTTGDQVRVARYEKRSRKGSIVKVPTKKDLETRAKNGFPATPYTAGPFDEPVAAHVFMVLCPDQEVPMCGGRYPEPLAIIDPTTKEVIGGTGLPEWPEE